MTPPRLLDADLLARFESLLRARGVNVDGLAPGLTDDEIDAIVTPWGLQLPEEVRAWWRWRNGGPARASIYLLPHRVMLGLEEAISSHVDHVKSGREAYADPRSAVQPVDGQAVVFVQCLARGDVPAPVHVVHDPAAPAQLALPSFGELVLTWISYIERGIYARRPDGRWSETQDYPPDILAVGVQ